MTTESEAQQQTKLSEDDLALLSHARLSGQRAIESLREANAAVREAQTVERFVTRYLWEKYDLVVAASIDPDGTIRRPAGDSE